MRIIGRILDCNGAARWSVLAIAAAVLCGLWLLYPSGTEPFVPQSEKVHSLQSSESSNELKRDTATIRIATGNWPPFSARNGFRRGITMELITETFELEGIRAEYGFFPWFRAYELAKQGVWDATPLWIRNEEREEDFFYSEPIAGIAYHFFHLKDEPFDWNTLDDLAGVRIGGTIGYYYGKKFQAAEESGKLIIDRSGSDKSNFDKLLNRRIRVFVMDANVGERILKNNFSEAVSEEITYHPRVVSSAPLHLIFGKKSTSSPELLQAFHRGLRKLRASGKMTDYFNKWLPADEKD